MRPFRFFLFPLLALLLCACSTGLVPGIITVTPTVSATPLPTQTPPGAIAPMPTFTFGPSSTPAGSATPTATPAPGPTATSAPVSRPLYTIDAGMDYDSKTLTVTQDVSYPNTGSVSLNDIVMAVEPNLVDGVFKLNSVSVDGSNTIPYTLEGQKLDITLPAALAAGQSTKISLAYTLALPEITQGDPNVVRPQIFGVTQRQVNLVDWYPFVVPYAPGSGWLLHNPWFYGEHLVYPLADFDVTLRFSNNDNLPVVAASAAPEVINGGTRYRLEGARDFSFSMGRQFQVLNQQVGDVTVYSYYLGDLNKVPGQAVLDAAVKAVQTYTELFGPYHHAAFSVVQGDFNDGMEFDGLVFLSNSFYNLYDNTEKNYLVMVTAHETSHQWWFGRVANDQAQEPWLDESLATYCEKLFYEKNYAGSCLEGSPDFVKLAEAYGAVGLRATKPEEVEPVLREAFAVKRPVLMDFVVAEEEGVYPIVPPGKSITEMLLA